MTDNLGQEQSNHAGRVSGEPVDGMLSSGHWDRRGFLIAAAGTGVIAAGGAGAIAAGPSVAPTQGAGPLRTSVTNAARPWYESAYRRAVIDMHIPDWDEKFLSRFDPQQYVDMLVKSRAQSVVCYCQSHVGLFNYPTKVGQQHRGLGGRNVLKEMIDLCHEKQIGVALYTSLIFDRWAGDQHPEWRMRTWENKIQGEGGRHCVLCVNSPYREYVRSFVREICQSFEFEGIRFDMTFWPWLCYCQHCQRRFDAEVGGEIPKIVNWLDEKWVAFQRCRERWLVEFAEIATSTVRELKPAASVEHQSSTFPLNWMFGVTAPLARQNDFLQGDFYGDALQGSFVRKLLEDLTPHRPFGFETSFSVELKDHTARKPTELLEAKASAAIADSGAFIFIDAIDPIGTVNPAVHERMGKVFDRLMPYYAELGGERLADVMVYYSLESKFNFAGNGKHVSQPDTTDSHTKSCMEAARRIISHHLPFGVATRQSLSRLRPDQILVLSNVNMLDLDEAHAIREWVKSGGRLYASGVTSLVDKQGRMQNDFMLADLFGVHLEKIDFQAREHYVAPTAAGASLFSDFDADYPAYVNGALVQVKAEADATPLATTTLPWPAPQPTQFASIHSNPPWVKSDAPLIVEHPFGKGRVIYSGTVVETVDVLSPTFIAILKRLKPDFRVEAKAHPSVEMTVFHQPDRKRYLVSLVNFQKDLPNIPIDGIEVTLRLGDETVRNVNLLPGGENLPLRGKGGVLSFIVPRLETLRMIAVHVG